MNQPALALGTVQFGVAYGIAGSGRAVAPDDARAILERAWALGIRRLDTAPAYGDIEERLADLTYGLPFEMVSKVAALPVDRPAEAATLASESIARSIDRLGDRLAGILFHRPDDLAGDGAAGIWAAAERAAGAAQLALGVSGYDAATMAGLARRFPLAMAQLPGNAFDQGLATEADALADVELTLRSAFLQGLLLMPRDQAAARLPSAAASLARWHDWCADQKVAPIAGALAIAKGLPGVCYCAVGVETVAQLNEIADAWAEVPARRAPELASPDPAIVDPRRWRVAA